MIDVGGEYLTKNMLCLILWDIISQPRHINKDLHKKTRAHSTIARRHYWTWSYYCGHKVKLLTWSAKNRHKSAILLFFSHYWTCPKLVISNMHNKFQKDTWKTAHVIAPTRSNYWSKNAKNHNKSAILIFFQTLLKLSESCLSATCITNLKMIHEKRFKLSLLRVNVNADADANADDAELQLP